MIILPSPLDAFFFPRRPVCLPPLPQLKEPPTELVQQPELPFQQEKKVEVPAEAKALGHFALGQLLLAEGEFAQALKEYETAAQADPANAYLKFRLATLYLRKGDLKQALKEAEEAGRLDPKDTDRKSVV